MSVDAITGEGYLKFTQGAKTEDIVSYFTELCSEISQQEFHKLTVILYNSSTHKKKMNNLWKSERSELGMNSTLEI